MMPTDDQQKIIMAIVVKLAQLGHEVSFAEPITAGPLVTTYRFMPKAAAKVAQITSCADDLALALRVEDVLIRRLPGEAYVGVSVPNATRSPVMWRDLLSPPKADSSVPLNFGVDSEGKAFRDDLTKLPHLLCAGGTGAGKSTLMHGLIASVMSWRSPEQVQFALSDTKNVEFSQFDGSPHLWCPTVTTMYTTWEVMDHLIEEMERRLAVIGRSGYRNIAEYNKGPWSTTSHVPKMSYIVFVIDELADILGGEKRGEAKIATAKLGRIVQKSRAAGVHVIACAQRPSVNIVAGSIKANFPARLTFRLPSQEDSRTVIGHSGAEHLLARGDMLYCSPNHSATLRLHSGYATTKDVKQCVAQVRWRIQKVASY
jgi:DNA segregation ATPase FtsK/SpoIIIE, S-DNA-T family